MREVRSPYSSIPVSMVWKYFFQSCDGPTRPFSKRTLIPKLVADCKMHKPMQVD